MFEKEEDDEEEGGCWADGEGLVDEDDKRPCDGKEGREERRETVGEFDVEKIEDDTTEDLGKLCAS